MSQFIPYSPCNANADAGFSVIYRDPSSQKLGKEPSYFTKIPDCVALDVNLSHPEFRVLSNLHILWRLHNTNPVPFNLSDFAKTMEMSRQQIGSVIKSLEKRGYISRAIDGTNGSRVLFFRSYENVYGEGVKKTLQVNSHGKLEITDRGPQRTENKSGEEGWKENFPHKQWKENFPPPGKKTFHSSENDLPPNEWKENFPPSGKKTFHPVERKLSTSETPNTEPSKSDDTLPTDERHDNSEARAFREKREKREKTSSLRSDVGSLRSPSSRSLRSHSVPDKITAPVSPSALEGSTGSGAVRARSLPVKKPGVAFEKDEDEGEQIGLFGKTKGLQTTNRKRSKKTPLKKALSRHKELREEPKKQSKGVRKTPLGCCTPGRAIKIFNNRLILDYPNTPISKIVNGQDIGQLSKTVSGYSEEVVCRMVDLLFDDWNAFKSKVWPKPTEGHPVVAHLWGQAKTLVTYLDTGIKDGSSRVSKHAIREKGAAKTYEIPDIKALYRDKYGSNNS